MCSQCAGCRQTAPCISVAWERTAEGWTVMIADNGGGWPLALAGSLLKPFVTSKQLGLGIGLSNQRIVNAYRWKGIYGWRRRWIVMPVLFCNF